FSTMTLGKNSSVVLAPGANVTIYMGGDIQYGQYSYINDGGVPNKLQVYSQGSLKFNQGCSFYGTFYGPNGDIQYDQTTNVYGSIVSKTIKLDAGACFHYDRSLSRVRHGVTGRMLAVAWKQT
ncbi:MAG: hypothetical protein HY851_03475, partial [candidate division Zixibacteria bacterium]|nr:hypothetical protein [candidate division Zixibacteria bacterium]